QDDIDALLSGALGGDEDDMAASAATEPAAPEPAEAEESPAAEGGPQSQDDIDALLSGALGGDDDDAAAVAEAEPEADAEADTGPQSQDDIDALLSGALGGDEDEAEPDAEPDAVGAAVEDDAGAAPPSEQDDIDALLAGAMDTGGDGGAEADAGAGKPDGSISSEQTLVADLGEAGDEADIAALLGEETAEEPPEAESMIEEAGPEPEEAAGQEEAPAEDAGAAEPPQTQAFTPVVPDAAEEEEAPAAPEAEADAIPDDLAATVTDAQGEDDLDALLSGAAAVEDSIDDILKATEGESAVAVPPAEAAEAEAEAAPVEEEAAPPEREPAPPSAEAPQLGEKEIASLRESMSLMEAGSELENMTGEIAGLLGQLSERARRYQNAYQTSSHEVNDIKARLRAEERKRKLLESEKGVLQEERLDLRARIEALESEHKERVEQDQHRIAELERQVRERENRVRQLEGEEETLGKELGETQNRVTEMEVETRKARFELERARHDLEAERQERARLQRAMDAREKEIQALQERGAGEASTLFIDELRRLVRRYENELGIRTGAARDALGAFERLQPSAETESIFRVLREALIAAAGLDESSDQLGELSRRSAQPAGSRYDRGEPEPGRVEASIEGFAGDLEALALESACMQASRLLAERAATPGQLMEQAYKARALREQRVAGSLMGVVMLFRQLLDAQREADQARGKETPQSERFYVQLFDLLHGMVRMKAISRSTPEAWRFFLDLRGRYSFITSDAQWTSYRDRQLQLA
ncbi:MAG: hypothetical protein ACOCX4_07880, partial [Planctomycetota bacterium]